MKTITTFLLSITISSLSFCQNTIRYEKKEYNIGVNCEKDELSVLCKDMISLDLKYSFFTTINEANVPFIHTKYGSNYIKNYCTTLVRSVMREKISAYTVEEILYSKRELVIKTISNELSETLFEDTILFKRLLIESILLPPSLQASMEEVAKTEQDVIVQRNILERTKIEAEIQSVRSKTDAEYNQMLDSTLTKTVLQMKYIEVLSKLSESQSSKVIILGNCKFDLPTILNE